MTLQTTQGFDGSTEGVAFFSNPFDSMDAAHATPLMIEKKWDAPLVVMNDGDVTALAGALSLRQKGMLGSAMGSSEVGGFMDKRGRILGWLNELAFAPVDCTSDAATDEWWGDRGGGALYFSQQDLKPALRSLAPVKRELNI